nr:MAG TPA: hypothetical protein [Inoviridae sp.]
MARGHPLKLTREGISRKELRGDYTSYAVRKSVFL